MFTRLARNRFFRVAGLAAGAVAVAAAAVVVTASAAGMSLGLRPASSSGPAYASVDASSASSTVCSDFMKHFAVEIGKTQAEINTAFQKAIADTLADEVKSGRITQAQADTIKAKLAKQTPCQLPSSFKGGHEKGALAGIMQQYLAAAAAALGISETQLMTDLKSGQSLSQIAAAQHVSEADFRTRLIANLKPALDKAVSDKNLTADQEQKIIQRLQTGELPLWNTAMKHPKAPASPSPSTT
jgi:hypothetical protein